MTETSRALLLLSLILHTEWNPGDKVSLSQQKILTAVVVSATTFSAFSNKNVKIRISFFTDTKRSLFIILFIVSVSRFFCFSSHEVIRTTREQRGE
jgi:hypothetical protein